MGNCGSNPKTNEAVPEPVTEQVKVEQNEQTSEANVLETPENKSLGTLLNQKVEEEPKTEEVKAEPKPEEPQEEKSKAEEAKSEA
ncbi:eukaryotic peptide chain release factor GTP-binding subunit-like [Glycine soja]|uniref:EKN n=1 Tax=Glycine soja TaxID=3848 RepID=A0A0B2S4R1_GLYSO|nr:eukaryotic peptide chain release factor GTP-binding subunit-like [Glycine soja]KAG4999565.1 hypothetical protein JHK87_020637 [Glycine soja]KHN39187.1 hypothetical protein glysoja_027992 [Glycine soja]RZB95764.1 hypothetical protein D0Y65_019896 [Glycine soja]